MNTIKAYIIEYGFLGFLFALLIMSAVFDDIRIKRVKKRNQHVDSMLFDTSMRLERLEKRLLVRYDTLIKRR